MGRGNTMKIHIWKMAVLFSVFLIALSFTGSKVRAAEISAIDITINMKWDDEEDLDGSRPEKVTVTLYANGNEIGRSVTLSADNNWKGIFKELPQYENEELQSYSVVEEKVDGYTGTIEGSDVDGYTITNIHKPLPQGRDSSEEASRMDGSPEFYAKGKIVETVVTTKVSKSMPARTSTTIKKTMSAKTADTSNTVYWGGTLLGAITALFVWMNFEQKRK